MTDIAMDNVATQGGHQPVPLTEESKESSEVESSNNPLGALPPPARGLIYTCTILFLLYFFLFSLGMMGDAFKIVGGCSGGDMFKGISNPIAGLMVGILATVLVQSSSTSTSIVVSLVGAGQMGVPTAIPVVMGANIGTSVTNTIVSMGQIGNPEEFKRAFAGATIHDMFNFLSVIILLPIEIITGLLEHLTEPMTPAADDLSEGEKWEGPVKKWIGPLQKQVVIINKKVSSGVAKGATCESLYAAGTKLVKCDKDTGDCPMFYEKDATLDDDMASGAVCLIISLFLLMFCLGCLVKVLNYIVGDMVTGTDNENPGLLQRAANMHWTISILIGAGVTLLVQSSSITTSVLTPLVGVGLVTVEQMFPLTLGANIGTTCTALLASLVQTNPAAVQIALCHLFFNIIGILIWYPLPFMRKIPLNAARALGEATLIYRPTPALYILVAFIIVPAILLGVSSLYEGTKAFQVLGVIITCFLVVAVGKFVRWWKYGDGKAQIMTMMSLRQDRRQVTKDLPATLKQLQEDVQTLKEMKGVGGDEVVVKLHEPLPPADSSAASSTTV